MAKAPFCQKDLFHRFDDRDAKHGVAVNYGNGDLDLFNLAVEVRRHEALPHKLHTVHLGLDAAPAVASTS